MNTFIDLDVQEHQLVPARGSLVPTDDGMAEVKGYSVALDYRIHVVRNGKEEIISAVKQTWNDNMLNVQVQQ
jgi:hypothetical protein